MMAAVQITIVTLLPCHRKWSSDISENAGAERARPQTVGDLRGPERQKDEQWGKAWPGGRVHLQQVCPVSQL